METKRDARQLSPDSQAELRRQAIRLLKQGQRQSAIAELLEVRQATISDWWKRYREGGWAALKPRKRGRVPGTARYLKLEQEAEVQRLITDHTPDQLKLDFALWTRQAVIDLITERFGVTYALQTMSEILARWGFTPQRPVKRAYEQRPGEVKRWLDETYPEVEARAKVEKAEIFWADETAVKSEAHTQRGFAPKGQTPVVRQPAKRFHSSVLSAINNRGKMEWMALKQPLNADRFICFLGQLIKYRRRKVILIVDNLRVHHAKPVKEWLEQHKTRIEVVYLPAYSPELNPDEYFNQTLKQDLQNAGPPPREKSKLNALVAVKMLRLQARPDRIKKLFHHPNVRYALYDFATAE